MVKRKRVIKDKDQVSAPFLRRLFAYIIDTLILFFVITIPLDSMDKKDFFMGSGIKDLSPQLVLLMIIVALLVILYWAILEFLLQQSLGKMVMKIKVISDNKELKFSQCLIRNITKISTLILIIDSIPVFKTGRRFTEKISKTRVVLK